MLKTLYKTSEQLHTVEYLGQEKNTIIQNLHELGVHLRRETNRQTVQNIWGFYTDCQWHKFLSPAELESKYGKYTWTGQFTVACGDFCMYRNPNDPDTPESAPICGVRIVNTQIVEKEIIYHD